MAEQFKNGGALFVRDKKSPKAPDYGGDFTLDDEVLDYILKQVENRRQVKLEISGWKRQGRNNTTFLSVSIAVPYADRQQNEGQQRDAKYVRTNAPRPTAPNAQAMVRPNAYQQASRPGQAARPARQELNDDIPFGNDPQLSGNNPWDD